MVGGGADRPVWSDLAAHSSLQQFDAQNLKAALLDLCSLFSR